MQARELRAAMQNCEWIFDFFAIAFDYLASRSFYSGQILERLAKSSNANLREQIASYDGDIPPEVFECLAMPDRQWSRLDDAELESEDFCFKLLSVLWQIDRAAADLNYFSMGGGRTAWPKVRVHLQAEGLRLNRGSRVVTIRPPHLEKKRWWQAARQREWSILHRGQHLDPLFKNLARVTEVVGASFVLGGQLPALFDRIEPEKDSLTIGVAPLIEDIHIKDSCAELVPGPLRIVPRDVFYMSGDAHHSFTIDIDGDSTSTMPALERRAAVATQLACESGVDALVFPELVVPDPVVRAISNVLRETAAAGGHTPRLTVAGSFGRLKWGRHYNEAIVLNSSGGELYRQRKMHAYKMFEYEQEKYDLIELFQKVPRQEGFAVSPRQLTFFDSRAAGYRTVVLICEDAAQSDPGRQATTAWHATMVLVPVMAGALEQACWCWQTAELFASDAGAVTVVANSGGLAKAQYRKNRNHADPPLGILGSPLSDPTFKNVRNAADQGGSGLIVLTIP